MTPGADGKEYQDYEQLGVVQGEEEWKASEISCQDSVFRSAELKT
jgi:hypothetical protein